MKIKPQIDATNKRNPESNVVVFVRLVIIFPIKNAHLEGISEGHHTHQKTPIYTDPSGGTFSSLITAQPFNPAATCSTESST